MNCDQIEAIMNDFIQLKPQSNVYEAETMIEGKTFVSCSGYSKHIGTLIFTFHFMYYYSSGTSSSLI